MIGELIYTSAPAGLRPGTTGFCTVAATKGLSKRDQLALEALSGYELAFGLSDTRAAQNPACFLHTTLAGASGAQHVLSRVGFAGADHTGRSNKIAHHLLLGRGEGGAGPAALAQRLLRDGRWATRWEGAPRETASWPLPCDDVAHRPASAWQQVTGDAGWAAALPRAFRARPTVPAFVVFAPGADVLALFAESLSVLPVEERWRVAFATYHTSALPPDRPCHWRGVLAGSPAAAALGRHADALVIDLTKALPPPEEDGLTAAVRRGEVARAPVALTAPAAEERASSERKRKPRGAKAVVAHEVVYELQPELAALAPRSRDRDDLGQYAPAAPARGGVPPWVYFAGALALSAVLVLVPLLGSRKAQPPGPAPTPPSTTAPAPRDAKLPPPLTVAPTPAVTEPPATVTAAAPAPRPTEAEPLTMTPAQGSAPSDESPDMEGGAGETPSSEPAALPHESAPAPLVLTVAEGGHEQPSVAPIITAQEIGNDGSRTWQVPATDSEWQASCLNGELKKPKAPESPATLDLFVARERVASLSLDRVEHGVHVRVTPTSPGRALPPATVIKLSAGSGEHLLLPLRNVDAREEVVGWVDGKLIWTVSLEHQLRPVKEARDQNLRIRAQRGRLEATEYVPHSSEEKKIDLLGTDFFAKQNVKQNDDSVSLRFGGQRGTNPQNGLIGNLKGIAATMSSSLASIATVRSELLLAEEKIADRKKNKDRPTTGEQETRDSVKKEFDSLIAKLRSNLLYQVCEMEAHLNGLELQFLDSWGVPFGTVRYRWERGLTTEHLKEIEKEHGEELKLLLKPGGGAR